MAKEIKFNVRLSVDGKEQLVTAATSIADLQRVMERAKGSAGRLRDTLLTYTQTVQAVRNVADAVSQLTGTLNGITEESRAFGAAMKAANTMAGKDAEGFTKLKDQVSELSKAIPIARDQLANGLYQVISNGVPEDNWISYLQASARSAVGGIADVGEVVKVTSTIIKNYGLEWDAAQDIQDKIQLTAKNGVTSFEQLAAALPKVTGQAAQLGVSFTEMLAVMSTLTGVSGNTAEVSTQLAATLTALSKVSAESQKTADAMGISFNAGSIKAAGGLKNFLQELDKAVAAYASKTGELKESIYGKLFGSAEALRLVNALTGQLAGKYEENTAALENSAGTMDAAYKNMASTGASQLQILKNEWGKYTDWIADKVGGIQPILNFGSQLGMTTVSVLTLAEAFKKLQIMQALMSKSVLRNIAAYALFGTNIRKVAAAINVMSLSFRSAATRAVALKVAIRGLLAATGVGLALTALSVVLEKLIGAFDKTGDAAAEAADGIDDLSKSADTVKETYEATLSSTYSDLMGKYEQLKQGWKSLSTEQEKVAWVKNNQAVFNDLRLEINNVSDAEGIFNGNTDAVVEAFTRRAKAAARMAQLTELYRKQIKLTDDYSRAKTSIQNNAAKAGDLVPFGWQNDRYGKRDSGGKWRFTEQGAKLYSHNSVYSSKSLRDLKSQMTANDAEIKRVGAQLAAENAAAKTKIKPRTHTPAVHTATGNTHTTTAGTGSYAKGNKISTEKVLIENAKTYKDLANNVAYYQQKLEECDITDTERIKALLKGKAAAEKAEQGFTDLTDSLAVPAELKTLDDYDKKLQYLRKQRQTASKEQIAQTDAQIEKTEAARQALEDESVATVKDGEIKTYEQLNKKLAYYNRLLESGDEGQRILAQNGINDLNKLQEAWDIALEETKFPATTNTVKDIDTAIAFYTERQQREDADRIEKTQAIIDSLTAKKRTLQLGMELPQMQKEISEIEALDGKEYKLKIRAIGFDGLTDKIEELEKFLNNTKSPLTDSQRSEVKELIAVYEKWRKLSVSSFDTVKNGWDGLKGIGGSIESITEALEGNSNAWQTVAGVIDGFVSLYESIQTVVGVIKMLTGATQGQSAAEASKTAQTAASTSATIAQTGATTANTAAVLANRSAKSGEAIASATASGAKLPFPANLAAIAAGVAAVVGALAMISGFASGGIVGGNSPTGDRLLARVNSGEMILNKYQQQRLLQILNGVRNFAYPSIKTAAAPDINFAFDRNMIQPAGGTGGTVRFEIDGRKLVGVMANETRVSSKSGKRTNIKV